MAKQWRWKEFYTTSIDDLLWLDSAWQSNRESFGEHKVFETNDAIGFARTNLSLRDCRALFRFADVRWIDPIVGLEEA